MRPSNFRERVYKPALKATGLSMALTPHCLRHSAGDYMRENGEDHRRFKSGSATRGNAQPPTPKAPSAWSSNRLRRTDSTPCTHRLADTSQAWVIASSSKTDGCSRSETTENRCRSRRMCRSRTSI
jgi:hypothetical protein